MQTLITEDIHPATIRPRIADLQPNLVQWRRQLHQHPELGFQEQVTAAFIADKLTDWQIEHKTGIAHTGVVALIQGTQPGPVFAIRADIDALPVQEENQVSYRSQKDGLMHACGHDGHTAIALGTAYYLSQNRHLIQGTVKIIFQPAEEFPGGAAPMIAEGALANPDVDAIVGLHIWNNLPIGTIGVRSGPLMAAVEIFDCTIYGKGGHGAIPQQAVDPIVVGAHIISSLQSVVARQLNPLEPGVVTIGQFHAGHAYNVIPDSASFAGTVRYFEPSLRDFFSERIEQHIAGICQSYGATYELDYKKLYPPTINHDGMAELVRSVVETVVETPDNVVHDCQTMGAEDMSFFLQRVPGCYFFLGSANAEKGLDYPHHHPRFDFDETVLSTGVEIFVRCLERFYEIHDSVLARTSVFPP
ncbi:MAG: M20 family metallopeptidase [Cyanobacteria bacterium P01_F01_bin.150]